ncbi:MAG TPA: hypothetical protein VEG60_16575 [Candidatus Binatia bacterium]|nr:hypothetical protein [Candidatus Binatia bacterium]
MIYKIKEKLCDTEQSHVAATQLGVVAMKPDVALRRRTEAALKAMMIPQTCGSFLTEIIIGEAIMVVGTDGLSAAKRAMCC